MSRARSGTRPPNEERALREAGLDRTIENTFPASDPPSTIPNPADERDEPRPRPDPLPPPPD